MKTYKRITLILLTVLFIISSSCGKYEDGPWFSIYSKKERATGNWRFDIVREDGVDITEKYTDQSVNMLKNGDLYWIQGYSGSYWNTYGPGGKWRFVNDQMQIEMHFTTDVHEEFTLIWDIRRLAYADLQLERYDGEKLIEWRLWKY